MEYSIVVVFSKKFKKTKNIQIVFWKKRPQLTEEKSRMRTGRLLTKGG